MKKNIFLFFCFIFHNSYTEQFIYPVADFEDGQKLMILYQKSLDCVELWIWDTSSQQARKSISSFLIPANLRMMPSGKGFSFIDQGYIKIKEFVKRSPRTLPIYEPIGLFSSMNWIDDETFYFVAREGDFFQIFQGDLQAHIKRLTYETADALYPQKINSTIFYMKRDINNLMTIVAQPWNPIAIDDYDNSLNYCTIMNNASQQLCFLHMISEKEGFYLQAPIIKINENNNCYEFSCYHLVQKNSKWTTENILSFKIPSKYITGSTRLYESLEPFLPNYNYENFIYFVTWQEESDRFELQKYNILHKTSENVSEVSYRKQDQQIFAPYIHSSTIYCGFIVEDQQHLKSLQRVFEMDDVTLTLPYFEIKK